MRDSCLADDPGNGSATVSVALNGLGVVIGLVALTICRLLVVEINEASRDDPAHLCGGRRSKWVERASSAAVAAILLGGTTVILYFSAGTGTEIGCVIALTNSIGPVPSALLAAGGAIALLVVDLRTVGGRPIAESLWASLSNVTLRLWDRTGDGPLFPSGPHWRARDAAVTGTAVVSAIFSGCVMAFYDAYLRVPVDASWDVTIGALAISSVCCGPLLLFLAAKEMSAFAAGGGNVGGGGGHSGRGPRGEELLAEVVETSPDGTSAASAPLLSSGSAPPAAAAVLRHWLLHSLPSVIANLVVYQFVLWLPVYGAEVVSEHFGLSYSDASTVAWTAVGLIGVGAVLGTRACAAALRKRRQGGRALREGAGGEGG